MISLEKEVEGPQIGSKNYRFSRIGSPVPIRPGSDCSFDSSSPPSRPLAISPRFRLCFISHSQGFCVARVDQVKAVAKKLNDREKLKKDEESGSEGSIQEVSIVDVEVGKVEILALSSDEAVLAAVVGNCIHFYAVSSLLHKEQKPSYSVSADDSNYIIDMRWAQLSAKEYVVLSHDGKLYQGCGQSPLKNIMDNVDAVEWSEKGDCVAVGRKNVLTIFSSEFKEKSSFLLSFKSVVSDSDASSRIKANCIRWVRSDCIMVGCLQLNDEGEEEDYLVQVITSEGGHIDDASAIPTVLAFYDIFLDYQVDVVPRASGPHLSLQYFDRQQIAFIANRKNLTQHVVLLGWGLSGKRNQASAIEIQNDSWIPQIELQGNGDDNIILGLSIYQVLENADVKYLIGEEETEVPPCCNLLCVTIDGKLSIFDFASAADALDSVEISDSHDEDDATLEVPSRQLSTEISTVWDDSEADTCATVGSHISSRNELVNTEASKAAISVQSLALFNQENKPLQDDHSLKGYKEPSSAQTTQNQDRDAHHTSYPWMQARNELLNTGAAKAAMPDQSSALFNQEKQPLQYDQSLKRYEEQSSTQMTQTQERDSQQGLQVKKVGQASPQTISEAKSSTGFSRELFKDGPSPTISNMSLIGHSTKLPNTMVTTDARSGSFLSSSNAFASPFQDPSYIKKADSSSINSFGRMPTSAAVNIRPSAALTQVPPQQKIGPGSFLVDPQKTYPTPSSTPVHKSKTNSLKQYQNIEEMVKKLDSLYEDIEGKGGFVDASVACQESSVAALEEKIWTTSRRCRDWKVTVDEQVSEMQDLLDKTVQVLSRKIYMEGIFKQACDTRYWDLWNRQKLSSELELKRRHIDEANKELTNQLIELERHFNILELNRFGESGGPQMDRRTSRKWHGQSRHIQSLQSLHTTTDAQLIAAEQLSENLFKQMAMLNIESPAKKQTIKKELFDTIGLSYDASSYSSAGKEKIPDTPLNKQLLSTSSVATIERTRRHHDSLCKTHEPETTRRRRDSLDQNWVNVAPPKTTVKRIILHEDQDGLRGNRSPFPLDRQHISTPLSREMVDAHSKSPPFSQNHLKGKGIPDIRDQYGNRSPSSALTNWGNRFPSTIVSEVSSQAAPPPPTSVGQIRAEMAGMANEKSGHVFPSKSTGSFMLGESNPIWHSGENLHGAQFSSSSLPVQTKTVTNNSDNNTSFTYTKGSDLVGQMSSFSTTSFSKGPLFPASNVNLDPKISWKVPDVASTNQSQHVEPASTDSSSLKGRDSSPAYLTSPPKQSEVTSFRGEIPNSNTSVAANQTTVESQGLTFPTTFSFLTPTSTVVSSTSVGQPTDMLSSKTEFVPVAKTSLASERLPSNASESGRIDTSETLLPSGSIGTVDNSSDVSGPQKDEASATQASSANANGNGFSTIAAAQKSEVFPGSENISELSQAAFQQSSSLRSGSEANSGGTLNPPSDMLSNAKSVAPHDVGLPSQSSTFGSFNSSVNAIPNIVTQEDEMDEEAPETSQVAELSSGFLQGFGSGFGSISSPNPNSDHPVPNPFGPQMINPAPPSSTFTMPASSGELFRPPSFSFSSLQPAQPSQSTGFGAFSGGFNGGNAGQPSPASGFGKPAQIGSGQQALGSVLGSFGQSRQLGGGLPGTGIASPGGFATSPGGFGNGFGGVSSPGGGFSSLASGGGGGGFSNLASGVGGFAASASVPGGFAAAATSPGGFAAAATAPGGFAAAPTGGGFASSANNGAPFSGGFGGFGGQQGGGGFSAFGGNSGTGRPSSELFTQIRK